MKFMESAFDSDSFHTRNETTALLFIGTHEGNKSISLEFF